MAQARITAHGFDDVQRRLQRAAAALSAENVAKDLATAAAPMAREVAADVPRFSGLTAADVGMVALERKDGTIAVEIGAHAGKGMSEAEARAAVKAWLSGAITQAELVKRGKGGRGGRAFILNFLEFGTGKLKARGIMRRAADTRVPAALKAFGELLGARIRKAFGGNA